MTAVANRPLRFFISYRRRAEADARLAAHLVGALKQEGCEVFIDVQMPVGVDWSNEIAQRVEWCDYMVVLLSAQSDTSEMVRAEARRAHEASEPAGDQRELDRCAGVREVVVG